MALDLHGKVVIENPESYDIEPGNQSGPDTQDYGVSMFHQLHCLVWFTEIVKSQAYSTQFANTAADKH